MNGNCDIRKKWTSIGLPSEDFEGSRSMALTLYLEKGLKPHSTHAMFHLTGKCFRSDLWKQLFEVADTHGSMVFRSNYSF